MTERRPIVWMGKWVELPTGDTVYGAVGPDTFTIDAGDPTTDHSVGDSLIIDCGGPAD